jgi:hypothetical protein
MVKSKESSQKSFILNYIDMDLKEREFCVYNNQKYKIRTDEEMLDQLNLETLDLLNRLDTARETGEWLYR